jgi:ectoine hydroxylase-related dioxygenase (phytanoyl-CoA dioxygenase family)
LAQILLGTDFVGFANRGYGIRMDHPNEDKFLTQWHQDYVTQLCSQRGIVLWSPLRDVTLDVGPVMLCPRSHREGIFPIVRDGGGSYGLKIKDVGKIVDRYPSIIPEVKTGDLVVIDYMTLHSSLPNRSPGTRWAMISRYFDFLEKTGISHGWKGGLQEGNSFERVHPELSEIKA